MNKLEEFVKNTSGETREVLEELVHSLADSIKEKRALKAKMDYIANDNRLLRRRLFGTSSEKLSSSDAPYQIDAELFNEFELCSTEIEIDAPSITEEETQATSKKPTTTSYRARFIR